MRLVVATWWTAATLAAGSSAVAASPSAPKVLHELVFDEVDGIVAVEAEHFYKQTLTEKRAWHITSTNNTPNVHPDADPPHVEGASGGAYVEILPDTRANHSQKLIEGENFCDQPGRMAVLHYKVYIRTPGRYYVWSRTFSTGTEDNGVHVGLDGHWPESGRRWQTVEKGRWAWDCKQRTPQVHAGVPMQLFLDIAEAGAHEILFSMREDGFEMDKFILARDKSFKPEGFGPSPRVWTGRLPTSSRLGPQPTLRSGDSDRWPVLECSRRMFRWPSNTRPEIDHAEVADARWVGVHFSRWHRGSSAVFGRVFSFGLVRQPTSVAACPAHMTDRGGSGPNPSKDGKQS